MRQTFMTAAVCITLLFAVCACTGSPDPGRNAVFENSQSINTDLDFDKVKNKDWVLSAIMLDSETIIIDRTVLAEEGFGSYFTISFDNERVSGIGAPNRFFAPYSLAEKQGISINAIAGTLMAAIKEPENLKEHDYYAYLQNVYRWNLVQGNLELSSKTQAGTEAILIFISKD
ncbi:MAG: META domain-containing protein [Treponema sp.]|nr:META domain-containing protein [Treponema sp.]